MYSQQSKPNANAKCVVLAHVGDEGSITGCKRLVDLSRTAADETLKFLTAIV